MATNWEDLESVKITSAEITENSIVGTTGSTNKYVGQANTVKALFDKFSNFIATKHNSLVDFLGAGYREIQTQSIAPTSYLTLNIEDSKTFTVSKCGRCCTLDINARWAGEDKSVSQKTFYTVGTLPSGYRPKTEVLFGLNVKMVASFISMVCRITVGGEIQIAQESTTPRNLLIVGNATYFTEE